MWRKSKLFITYLSILLILLLIFGCTSQELSSVTRPQMPVIASMRNENIPLLIGVNYIRYIPVSFSKPMGISVDAEGMLYVADSGKSIVYVLNDEGKIQNSIGRFGWQEGEFDSPADVALDQRFQLYIADSGNNRIQRYGLMNRRFSVIAGEKDNESGLILSHPQGIATDLRGHIYIADTWNHRILKVDPSGRLMMEISNGQLRNPSDVAVDIKDNIYILDSGNNRIHKLDFGGREIAVWGQKGSGEGQFMNPSGVAIDTFGYVYVADSGNSRMQIFDPDGNYIRIFGRPYLKEPVGIAFDRNSHVYITDAANGNIHIFKIIYQTPGDER